MVELKTIPTGSLGVHIHEAFKGDWQLINTYHLVNGSLIDCVKSTFTEIDKFSSGPDKVEYYGIYLDGKTIGFTVVGENFLLSFGINIQYRTKEIVMQWWNMVCMMLNKAFVTWLFKKNTRAIDFCKRNGMEVIEDFPEYVTLLYDDRS